MKLARPAGTTSQIVHVFIQDSTVTTGAGKTGLIHSNITAYYVRAGGVLTALTMETIATLGTWASTGDNYLGFKLLHNTNAPGGYELHLPNNILAAGSSQVTIFLQAAGAAQCQLEIQLGNLPADVQAYTVQPTVTGATLHADYNAAKTAAQAGNQMDLVNAPNGTAVTALQSGLATVTALGTLDGKLDSILEDTGTTGVLMADGSVTAVGTDAASKVLVTPAQKLATDASGHVTLANGAHGGAAATLALKSATINNDAGVGLSITGTTDGALITGTAGDGMHARSTGGNGHGSQAQGNGSGAGQRVLGGGTGHGAWATGGSAASGIYAAGGAAGGGAGVSAIALSGNTPGLELAGNGTGAGLDGSIAGNITGDLSGSTGSVTGAVGSVTGAVGSVTGDVGGKVLGGGAGTITGTGARVVDAAGANVAPAATALSNAIWTDAKAAFLDAAVSSVHTAAESAHTDASAAAGDAAAAHAAIDALLTTVGAAGAGLTALGDTRLANLDAAVSSRSSHAAADVKTALEADGSKLDHLWEMTEDDAGVRRLTANAQEQAPAGSLTAAAVRQEIDANSTQLAAIVADTDEVQAELADGGRTDLLIDALTGGAATHVTFEPSVEQ